MQRNHPKSLIDILSDGAIIKSIENKDTMEIVLKFIDTLDEKLNSKYTDEKANFLDTIKGAKFIRKTLDTLARNMINN